MMRAVAELDPYKELARSQKQFAQEANLARWEALDYADLLQRLIAAPSDCGLLAKLWEHEIRGSFANGLGVTSHGLLDKAQSLQDALDPTLCDRCDAPALYVLGSDWTTD